MGFREATSDLRLKPWEWAAAAAALALALTATTALLTDFSLRRALWPSSGEGALARPIGKVTTSLNTTLRQGHEQPEFLRLSQGDSVYPLDTLISGSGSALKVTLNNGTVPELGENSMIRLSFGTSLQLTGIDREPTVEIVAGTVAGIAVGRELKLQAEDKTFTAQAGKGVQVERKGTQSASAEQGGSLVEQVKQQIARREALLKQMGGKVTDEAAAPSIADLMARSKGAGASDGAATGKDAKAGGKGGAAGVALQEATQIQVAKASQEGKAFLESAPTVTKNRVRVEIASVTKVQPKDGLALKGGEEARKQGIPVEFSWQAHPENSSFKLRIAFKGQPDEVIDLKAKGDDVEYTHRFKRAGSYTWKIEDYNGSILSVRRLHVDARAQAIELPDPILIGRERGSKMWSAGNMDAWAFQFRWNEIKGVKTFKVKVNRNADGEGGLPQSKEVSKPGFLLPYKKEWATERMFFSVEATGPDGFELYSRVVPFMFTFLPPKLRVPKNRKLVLRGTLVEGALPLNWEANSEASEFTVEVASDPLFKKIVTREDVDENQYRFYPGSSGTFYWHVKGNKDNLSSPYSETWEFTIK